MKEKEFFQLLEALPFGIVMLDGDDRVVCRNGTAKDILEKLAHFSGGATLESLDIYAWKDLKKYSSLPVFVVHAGRKYQVSIRDSVGGAHLLLFQDVTLQAEKRSQEILRARLQTAEDILKVLTHSFNNILTVFFAYSERLLKKSEPGSPMAKALKEMLDVSGKGRALIEKIMTIRRKTKCLPVPVLLGHFFKGKRKSYEEL
ncbi:MAG TPA: hypothetical protein VJC03_06110, partial [bacterium]|nr:hypothetical protein [bacterium]